MGVRVLDDAASDDDLAMVTAGQDWFVPCEIADPGAMQWFRIDKSGTYSVGFIDADEDLQFRIYAQKDFSVPVPQYREETYSNGLTKTTWREYLIGSNNGAVGNFGPHADPQPESDPMAISITFPEEPFVGKTHVFTEPPYYIRVFHPNRNWAGKAKLRIHRHGCSSEDDVCYLLPYAVEAGRFGVSAQMGAQKTAFFALDLEALDNGAPQQLTFWADCVSGPLERLELSPAGDAPSDSAVPVVGEPPVLPPWNLDIDSTDKRYVLRIDRNDLIGPAPMRLTVTRPDTGSNPQPLDFEIGWMTNLNVFFGDAARQMLIECKVQEDITFDDDIAIQIFTDGFEKVSKTRLGKFDDAQKKLLPNMLPGAFPARFAKSLTIRIFEIDVDANDVKEYKLPAMSGGKDVRIQAQRVKVEFQFVFPATWPADDGEYGVYGWQSHGLQALKP